jgi:hypothetical protein
MTTAVSACLVGQDLSPSVAIAMKNVDFADICSCKVFIVIWSADNKVTITVAVDIPGSTCNQAKKTSLLFVSGYQLID